jgi:hypothetical protein
MIRVYVVLQEVEYEVSVAAVFASLRAAEEFMALNDNGYYLDNSEGNMFIGS